MNLDIEDMLAKCLPGGNLCDPQMVADDIRAYMERAQAPSSDLPTKPGFYWWRAKEGDEWIAVEVWLFGLGKYPRYSIPEHGAYRYTGPAATWKVDMGIGQWLPCIPPASPKPPRKLLPVPDGWRVSDCGQYIERVGDGQWIVHVGCEALYEDHGSSCWNQGRTGFPSTKGTLYRLGWVESEVQG